LLSAVDASFRDVPFRFRCRAEKIAADGPTAAMVAALSILSATGITGSPLQRGPPATIAAGTPDPRSRFITYYLSPIK
jgi:hypothetical protein